MPHRAGRASAPCRRTQRVHSSARCWSILRRRLPSAAAPPRPVAGGGGPPAAVAGRRRQLRVLLGVCIEQQGEVVFRNREGLRRGQTAHVVHGGRQLRAAKLREHGQLVVRVAVCPARAPRRTSGALMAASPGMRCRCCVSIEVLAPTWGLAWAVRLSFKRTARTDSFKALTFAGRHWTAQDAYSGRPWYQVVRRLPKGALWEVAGCAHPQA